MSIIKEKIRYYKSGMSGDTMNMKITLSSRDAFIGYEEEIKNLTEFTATDLVNPVIDGEMRRFKFFSNFTAIRFDFYNTGGTWYNNFLNPGFTANEIASHTENTYNSFFILDYYDSFDTYIQKKIFTTYLTKILVEPSPYYSIYTISSVVNNQFYNWLVPESYISGRTGTVTGYTKFSFYNAKTGRIQLFYNSDNEAYQTPEKLYFKTELNLSNRTWKIITPSALLGTIIAKELPYNINVLYTDRVNSTIDKFENLAQKYPSGNTFNYIDGSYLTI